MSPSLPVYSPNRHIRDEMRDNIAESMGDVCDKLMEARALQESVTSFRNISIHFDLDQVEEPTSGYQNIS